jgi:REP element-mobilizing transposase RayT
MKSLRTHHRKSIRLKEYDYSTPGEYFITIYTRNRVCILGEIVDVEMRLSKAGIIVKHCWKEIQKHFQYVELDEHMVMPNHIHRIIILTEPIGAIHNSPLRMTQYQRRTMKLSKIIGWFKMTAAKEINILRRMPGHSVWQRSYFERIIRNDKELDKIRDYLSNNVLKWAYEYQHENPDNL